MDERDIFIQVIQAADAAQGAALVQDLCGQDQVIRQRVEALLDAHGRAASFLESPPADLAVMTDSPPIAERSGTVIGPYKLLQQIGEGGMGVVFMAEQTEPIQRTVALKIIKPGMDTRQVIARFEAERQAVAIMDHPNIAKVLDAGTTETGRPYFAMELVKGVPITKYCDEKRLSLRDRLDLFMQVCQAVQHAHQKGIIHRDLKPTNVLVAEYDDRAVPKVIDFGVAKATAQKLTERTMFTELGQVIGTVEYMSPEQAKLNQLDIDTRSDIYSLGVLLYELLTGTTPLERQRLNEAAFDEMLRIIREEEPPKPSTRLSTSVELASIAANRGIEPFKLTGLMRGELDWIAMRALEKDRNRRYETANGLAQDIEHYLRDEPVHACPPTQVYRIKKFMRRHKAAVAASALVLTALVVGAGVATWGLIVAREDRALAKTAETNLTVVNNELASQLERTVSAEKLASSQATQMAEQLYDIKLPRAVAAVREGQYATARENLNQCPGSQRGWEWKWLARQVNLSLPATIRGRQLAQFTPDGKQVVAVDGVAEKSVKFWNATSGAEERTVAQSDRPIKQVLIDLDANRLATGTEDGTVALWNVATGQQLWAVKAHDQRSDGLAFRPDGNRLVSVSWDGTLKVFDVKNGEVVASAHVDQELRSACFSPDGKQFVTAGRNNEITKTTPARVWDAETAHVICELPGNAPRCATYSLDRRWIATGNYDGSVNVYGAQSFQLEETKKGHEGLISAIAFSSDSTRLATSGSDAIVRIWDTETRKLLTATHDHSSHVNFVSFSPDGERAVSTDNSGVIHIWDVSAAESFTVVPVDSVPVRTSGVESVVFSPDGQHLLAGTSLGEVKLFDTASLEEECDLALPDCMGVNFAPDGRNFAASGVGTIAIWDMASREKIRVLNGHQGWVQCVAYSPDGRRLVSSGNDGTIRLWDVNTGAALHVLRSERTRGTICLTVFRPDGKQIASVGDPGLKIWDARSGSLLYSDKDNVVAAGLVSVAYSPDGMRLVAGGTDRLIHVLDARTFETRPKYSGEHAGIVRGLAFSPDGSRVVSGDATGMIRIWNADTGLPVFTLSESDGVGVYCVAFSPDGNSLAAAKYDGTMLVWELKARQGVYQRRRITQTASRIATAATLKADWTDEALSNIRGDESLGAEVKQLALRLAQNRLAVVPAVAQKRLEWFRFIANTPEAGRSELNDYAWELLQIYPMRLRDPVEALSVAKRAVSKDGERDYRTLYTLALAFDANGDPAKATDAQQKAIESLPPGEANRSAYVERFEKYKSAAMAAAAVEKESH